MVYPENPRAIVCGGRDFGVVLLDLPEQATIEQRHQARLKAFAEAYALACFLDSLQPREIAHGGAQGADTVADVWARSHGVPVHVYEADWRRFGKSAGPRRNRDMFGRFNPDVLVACPGNRGTADMVWVVEQALRPVLRVEVTADDFATATSILGAVP